MSIKLTEYETHWKIEQMVGPGKRPKMPRVPVLVEKGDRPLLLAKLVESAEAARKEVGVYPTKEELVV